ncbi:hypothetical protein AYI68_g3994 [Smittium mucronatum]|uniref:Uncharacterized protein n=1 Tax=Smittium mucronatum TaxID=133383 RepID=A0A1R0GYD1_9FUNG|nr:hypothetical protein AYI68_g3994 [Smittium mucronatum]
MKGGAIPYGMIYGAAASRLYYYLKVDYPAHGGRRQFIRTPQLYLRIFDQTDNNFTPPTPSSSSGFKSFSSSSSSSVPVGSSSKPNGVSHFWGQGKKLA